MIRASHIAGAYDTETTTLGERAEARAFPCVYICNDLTGTDLREYVPGEGERIELFRYRPEVLEWLERLIADGFDRRSTPIVCVYNMMFDLAPLMEELAANYQCEVVAQSSTHVYTLDLCYEDTVLLRLWDTYYLEMGGLAAMGRTCGLAKAVGDWDYSLVRTPETPITPQERHYAARDVQVIPAYLRYLLEANTWLEPDMLGTRVVTKTSLVRQMAKREIGRLRIKTAKGNTVSLRRCYELNAEEERPRNFHSWALRRACFRGGLTFTAANRAAQVCRDVASLDVTSMHHLYINGLMVPRNFTVPSLDALQRACEAIAAVPLADVLASYWQPLPYAVNARIRFDGLRLRRGSVFAREGIATLASGKLTRKAPGADWGTEAGRLTDECARSAGWMDRGHNVEIAFGKIMEADWIECHVTELELWTMAQVYEWDAMEVVCGELAQRWVRPPDYVTLQSHILFAQKQALKHIVHGYREGEPYAGPIASTIPAHIADELRAGTCSAQFLASYYNSTVKGMFNGIYGVQAQNTLKPEYLVMTDGTLAVDQATVPTADNWEEVSGEVGKVWYTYGTRIVGGSRMHLAIALMLLFEACPTAVAVGGDTDSIKLANAPSDAEILRALEPLHRAARSALDRTGERVRRCFPELTCGLDHVGEFDIESCAGGARWPLHWEAWNKARLSMAQDGSYHVTCAGLPRPEGAYHIERWCDDMAARGRDFAWIANAVLGYNATMDYSVCRYLQRDHPKPWERVREAVTDYLGNTCEVDAPRSIALFPGARDIGDASKLGNAQNLEYLNARGVFPEDRPRLIGATPDGQGGWKPWISYDEDYENEQ